MHVGAATPFTVTQTSLSATLYPNQPVTVYFKIVNPGGGAQHYTVALSDFTVANSAGTVLTANSTPSGSVVTGCKASWFTVSTLTSNGKLGNLSGTLSPGTHVTLSVNVTMSNGTGSSGSTQNACQTKFPKLTVSLSA